MSTNGTGDSGQNPKPAASPQGSVGAANVWADIEKAYDVEYRHNERLSNLNIDNSMAAVSLLQSQMLALFLGTEAERGLVRDDSAQATAPAGEEMGAAASDPSLVSA